MQTKGKNSKLKIAAIILAVVLCICAGAYVAYSYVNSGRFRPDTSGMSDVKINEIDLNDKSEKINVQKQNKADTANDLANKKKNSDGANDAEKNNKKIFVAGRANKYIINPNGNNNVIDNGNGMGAGDIINGLPNGDGTTNGNGGQNGNGGNNGGSNNNGSNSNNGGNSSNNRPADNNGDTNVIFPNLPSIKDPEKTIPDDIYDSESWLPSLPSYKDDNPDNVSDNLTLKVDLATTDIVSTLQDLELCDGQELTQEILLCRVWAYAMEDGLEKYRIREISDNFYIKDFPEKAYNGFKATFCFRQTANSDWQETTLEFPTVERKLYVTSYEEGVYPSILLEDSRYIYPNKGDKVSLLSCYKYMQPSQSNEKLTQLFRGWSEEPNGVPICDYYNVSKDGIIYLYPTGYVNLPSEYEAIMTAKTFDANGILEWHQTLSNYTGKSTTLTVPKYIQLVCFDEFHEFNEVTLPYTVSKVSFDNNSTRTLKVKKRYTVAQDSNYLSTVDGALASKDKTIIYDIPSDTTEFSVPDTVTEIDFSEYNSSLKTVVFSSEKAPKADISKLDHAKIYVPNDSLLDYMNKWGANLGTNELLPSDGSSPEYIYANGAILSDFGRTLYSVDSSAVGTLILPDSVERIPAGSIANENIDSIIFGKNFREIENGAINADNIKRLFFVGESLVEIGESSISALSSDDDDIQVYVQSGIADEFKQNWSAVMGDRANNIIKSDAMSYIKANEFEYLNMSDGAILYKSPKDLKRFDENTLDVTVKEIGSNAFNGCEDLRFADLAESIKRIGKYAFRDCNNLEGVYSYSRDEITVDKWVFTQYKGFNSKLKYVVFNALYGYLDKEYQNINKEIFFAPYDTYGYDSDFVDTLTGTYICYYADYYKDGFKMERRNGDERIIYAYDEYASDSGPGYVVCAATVGIEGTIELPKDTKIVHDFAFANCQNKFTLKNYESLEFISTSAFASSGISGEYNFKSLTWLFDCAFSGCKNLTKLELPKILSVQNLAFGSCSNLEEVEFGDKLTTIMSGAFYECEKLTKITVASTEPVELYTSSWGSPFYFGYGADDTFDESKLRIELTGEAKDNMQAYLDHWYVNLFGFNYDEMTSIGYFYGEDDLAKGEKRISSLFGVDYTRPDEISIVEWSLDDGEREVNDEQPEDIITDDESNINDEDGDKNVEGQNADSENIDTVREEK